MEYFIVGSTNILIIQIVIRWIVISFFFFLIIMTWLALLIVCSSSSQGIVFQNLEKLCTFNQHWYCDVQKFTTRSAWFYNAEVEGFKKDWKQIVGEKNKTLSPSLFFHFSFFLSLLSSPFLERWAMIPLIHFMPISLGMNI